MRRIRVHLGGESTFVIVTRGGKVAHCTRQAAHDFIGRPELDVARELKARGAVFVDLVNERQTIGVRRGYRPVDTSVPYRGRRKGMGIKDEAPRVLPRKTGRPKATPVHDPRNRIVESIRDFDPNSPGPERDGMPF